MAKEVLHVFKVKQSENTMTYRNFPIDMLRHDRCYPASERDSLNISNSFNFKRSDGFVGEINICRYADKQWSPSKERWLSFGWDVVSIGTMS